MAKFLASGLRRDLLVLVRSMEDPRAQVLKRALESHYEERITPRDFHGTMDALCQTGFLTRTADGVHDRYSLTQGGERSLMSHYDWMQSHVEDP